MPLSAKAWGTMPQTVVKTSKERNKRDDRGFMSKGFKVWKIRVLRVTILRERGF